MKRLFTTFFGVLFLFGTVSFVYAQSDVAKKMMPIIAMLLLDDASFPEDAVIHIGEENQVEAFVGKNIDQSIVVTENGVNTTNQYQFELVSGPPGLSITLTGLVSYTATDTTPLGPVAVEIKVIDKTTGAEKTITFTVFVMETAVIATGNIGPAGGIVADDWEDVVLHVPVDAVPTLSTFKVLRGISPELTYVYTILVPENVNKGLVIRLPHPELRNADHDPYVATQATNRPVQDAVRAAQVIRVPAADREETGAWNKWTSRPANYITINSEIFLATNRIRNDSDELQPAGIGIYNDTQTGTKLYSLCPESDSEYSSGYCGDKDPVLFIHGYKLGGRFSGGYDYWGQLPELIFAQGYAVFEFTWRTNARFVDVANDLASAIRKINKISGKKVHIVAHSFGGLLARTYLQGYAQLATKRRDYANDVQSLVTIGTPHSGIFDSAKKYYGVDFPKGQDSRWFEGCLQISCNQAGEPTPGAWTYSNSHLVIDYSDYFGVNPDHGPGELVAKLDATKDELPVDTLVLMGLVTSTNYSTQYYKSGDNMITFAGQRFKPEWVDSQTNPVEPLASGATLTEKIMGFSDSDMHPTATPGKVVPASVKANMTNPYKPFTGYYHSEATKQDYGARETFVEVASNIQGLNRPHAALTEIKQWLATHSSDPKIVTELPLNITVVDAVNPNMAVSGAQVEILVEGSGSAEGVTDANGLLSLDVPFIPYGVYGAIVKASGYHNDTHDTGYRSGATIAESGTDFGTIRLQSDSVATGSLGGQVTDADTGLPIAGVDYTMTHNTVRVDGATDASGYYSEADLVRDMWTVTFSKPGYVTKTVNFWVNPGSNTGNATLSQGTDTPLNDTGIDWGGDYPFGNNITCTSSISSPQDCHQGRDATHDDDSDGHAGFSFTRLNADGSTYTGSGNYATAPWACVRDNVTGLVWEVKTDDGGIHDKDNTYRWGGKTHLGSGYGTYYNEWDTLVDGSNGENLCGFSDWYVPTTQELGELVNFDQSPSIDTDFFPNAQIGLYWSASPSVVSSTASPDEAWYIDFSHGGSYSSVFRVKRFDSLHVRLVRGGVQNPYPSDQITAIGSQTCRAASEIPATTPTIRFTDNGNETVTDNKTGLMWAKCSEGLSGTECLLGSAATHNWRDALNLAADSTLAGHNDWRLPNIKELASIVERQCKPAFNLEVFPNLPPYGVWYWSASPYARYPYVSNTWYVSFGDGRATHYYGSRDPSHGGNVFYVRLVRGGQ